MPKKDKNQKQRKRRNKNRQINGVPYYGSWWVGVTYPSAVYDHEHFYSGGGTTEQSNPDGGGDSGGGVSAKLGSLEEEIINHNIQTSPPDVDHRFIIYQGQGFFWVEKQYLHRDLVFQGIAKDQGIDIKDVFTDSTFISGYFNKDDYNGDFLYIYEEEEPLPVAKLMILKEFYPDTPFYTVSFDIYYPMPGFPDFEEDHGIITAKLAAAEPIATIARVSHNTYPSSNSVNGVGTFEGMAYDPVEGEVAVVNLKEETKYVPLDSVRICPIYPTFIGGEYDEIAMILDGDNSYVWSSSYQNNANVMPSHAEVAETLLGIVGVQLYDTTTVVLNLDGTLKIFSGDLDQNEENINRIISRLEGATINRVMWNGEDVSFGLNTTSIRESVLQEGLEHMGYLGCFYCKRSIEEIRTLVTSKFMDTDYLVPSCPDCRR